MDHADVRLLATTIREGFAPESLDHGVTEPTLMQQPDGFMALVEPRDQMTEPYRSIHLLDAVATGDILVITFRWDDGDDGTVFLMPLDTRDVQVDLSDDIFVRHFVDQHLHFTLGAAREVWEPERATRISERLSVVRPYNQDNRR
jgi:hypothetical protein